jgi:hypothetical protein
MLVLLRNRRTLYVVFIQRQERGSLLPAAGEAPPAYLAN